MTSEREKALKQFWGMVRWIVAAGVLMVVGALVYLRATGELYFHMVVATIGGVFLSVVLGCGLMAASFFSDKSGHDQTVTDATRQKQKSDQV